VSRYSGLACDRPGHAGGAAPGAVPAAPPGAAAANAPLIPTAQTTAASAGGTGTMNRF
jgi:hypothetical protein